MLQLRSLPVTSGGGLLGEIPHLLKEFDVVNHVLRKSPFKKIKCLPCTCTLPRTPSAGLLLPNVDGFGSVQSRVVSAWLSHGLLLPVVSSIPRGMGGMGMGSIGCSEGSPQPAGSLRLQSQQNTSFCSSDKYLSTDPSWVFSVKLVIAVQSKDRLMYTSPWQRLGKSL